MPNTKGQAKNSEKPTMRELAGSGGKRRKRSLKGKGRVLGRHFKKVFPEKKHRFTIKFPDNRAGRALDKILLAFPRYLRGAWSEIRQTTWPSRRETMRLTFAVFVFSIVFAVFVSLLDFGFDKLFKHLIIK